MFDGALRPTDEKGSDGKFRIEVLAPHDVRAAECSVVSTPLAPSVGMPSHQSQGGQGGCCRSDTRRLHGQAGPLGDLSLKIECGALGRHGWLINCRGFRLSAKMNDRPISQGAFQELHMLLLGNSNDAL